MNLRAIVPFLLLSIFLGSVAPIFAQENIADYTLRPDPDGETTIVTMRVVVPRRPLKSRP